MSNDSIITPRGNIPGRRVTKAQVILNAWHNYCMQSRIFRILVKLGLRK